MHHTVAYIKLQSELLETWMNNKLTYVKLWIHKYFIGRVNTAPYLINYWNVFYLFSKRTITDFAVRLKIDLTLKRNALKQLIHGQMYLNQIHQRFTYGTWKTLFLWKIIRVTYQSVRAIELKLDWFHNKSNRVKNCLTNGLSFYLLTVSNTFNEESSKGFSNYFHPKPIANHGKR